MTWQEAPPAREALEAGTDQVLAHMRDARTALELGGSPGAVYLAAAECVADVLRLQFPGIQAGRIVTAAAQSAKAVLGELPELGTDGVVAVLALAGEQLDREASGEVRGG